MVSRTLVLFAILLTGACSAGWRRSELELGALKPSQQVQVWRGGAVTRWHAVVVTPDTVSVIPFLRSVECDTCRVGIPRAQVDSIRLGNPVAAFWKTFGLVLAVPLGIMIAVCIETGSWPGCFPTDGG
ncbi:MAG: hypothetical protein HW416_2127 [Chloroflexi bacterium]|nr:hypothetical protein [Chloroflexota bacterium]